VTRAARALARQEAAVKARRARAVIALARFVVVGRDTNGDDRGDVDEQDDQQD